LNAWFGVLSVCGVRVHGKLPLSKGDAGCFTFKGAYWSYWGEFTD
jgi:hypothetical protein